jgi:hypothetical protein
MDQMYTARGWALLSHLEPSLWRNARRLQGENGGKACGFRVGEKMYAGQDSGEAAKSDSRQSAFGCGRKKPTT